MKDVKTRNGINVVNWINRNSEFDYVTYCAITVSEEFENQKLDLPSISRGNSL